MIIDMLNNGMDSLKRGFSSYLKYEEIVKEKESVINLKYGFEIKF